MFLCHRLWMVKEWEWVSEVAQSCPTLSDPMDHSLPGSSICGIFQARVGCHCLLQHFPLFPPNWYSPSCQPPNTEESGQILQDLCYLSIFLACGKLTAGPTWTSGLPLPLGIKWLKTMKRELDGQGKTQIVPLRSSPLKKSNLSQSREPILLKEWEVTS